MLLLVSGYTDPRVPAKVALTPQRKSFGGGCSWRNKAGGADSQEDNVDVGPSALARREETGMYAFDEDVDRPGDKYCFGRAEYNRVSPYLGHTPHLPPTGVDRGSERSARTPRKIDHVPLRDQARREAEDYKEGQEQDRGIYNDKVSLVCALSNATCAARGYRLYTNFACLLSGFNDFKGPIVGSFVKATFYEDVHKSNVTAKYVCVARMLGHV